MNSSSNATHVLPAPEVVWAQRKDRLLLTFRLQNCIEPTVELKDKTLYFKGKGGSKNIEHELTMVFNKEIDPESKKTKYNSTGREVKFVLAKKEEGFWNRLLSDTKKAHYLKTDFDNWKDEDDTDAEDNEDFNLDEMMQSMGGLQGAGGMGGPPDLGDDEEDSDDEDLPDLQQ